MNVGHLWLIFSGCTGLFWGVLIGLLVAGIIDNTNGLFAGIFFGWFIYHLGLLVGGMAVTAKQANGYTLHN